MKHIFILNPAAGKGEALKIRDNIFKIAEELDITTDFEIYETKKVDDALTFVRKTCENNPSKEILRFYSCGGDGTLNEIVNGVFGFPNAEVAAFPTGTGNDFIRNFENADFESVRAQVSGRSVPADIIYYEYIKEGNKISGYGINMFNIGFDADVVNATDKYKKIRFFKGHLAYFMGIIQTLFRMKGINVRIYMDEKPVYQGNLLLIALANGSYCGGGIKGVPTAKIDDGLIDISFIKRVSRHTFIKLFPKYKKGEHIFDEEACKIVEIRQCQKVKVLSEAGPMNISIDGEMMSCDNISFEAVSHGIKFVIPESV